MSLPKSAASLWEAIQSEIHKSDDVPSDWETAHQLCERFNKSASAIQSAIASLLKKGKAERRLFRIRTASGIRRVPHYRIRL